MCQFKKKHSPNDGHMANTRNDALLGVLTDCHYDFLFGHKSEKVISGLGIVYV